MSFPSSIRNLTNISKNRRKKNTYVKKITRKK